MPGTPRQPLSAKALAAPLVAAALLFAGCGSDDEGTIPEGAADNLLNRLEILQQEVEQGRCATAAAQAEGFVNDVEGLGERGDIDRETQEALSTVGENLVSMASDPEQCEETNSGDSGVTGVPEEETVEPAPTETTTEETTTEDEGSEDEQQQDESNQSSENQQPEQATTPPQDQGGGDITIPGGGSEGDIGEGEQPSTGQSGQGGSGGGNSGGIGAPRESMNGSGGRR